MGKRYRANIESGMIHDLGLPCWWALNTKPRAIADFATEEEAITALKEAGMKPIVCGRCRQRRTSKKFLQKQERP